MNTNRSHIFVGWLKTLMGPFLLTLVLSAQWVAAATSVSQHGIAWTWREDRPVGQYANGDWFVVGPITLTGPISTDGTSGTMVNPEYNEWSSHGLDVRISPASYSQYSSYSADLNKGTQMPLVVAAGSTVVSCVSYPDVRLRNQIDSTAILTVVAQAPAAGSFRPPYLGTDKTSHYNKSQIDYSKLQKLALVAGADLSLATGMLERPMFNIGSRFSSNYLLGWYDTPYAGKNYGREITMGIARVALELNLNYTDAQKELMAIRMVQHGIDYYGGILQGQKFLAAGGHQAGRKMAVAMAGLLLNDASILDRLDPVKYPGTFAEDTQHFRVTQLDIDTPRTGAHPLYPESDPQPYTYEHLGMGEWGPDGGYPKTTAGSNWNRVYREVVTPACAGEALAATLSGLETAWKHSAFFDHYKLRAVPYYGPLGKLDPFVKAMWDAYGAVAVAPNPIAPPGNLFAVGERIETTRTTNVRSSGALSATLLGQQTQEATGVIVSGPVMMDNITWFQIDYDSGVDGWSGDDNFIKASSPTVMPSAPTGLRTGP